MTRSLQVAARERFVDTLPPRRITRRRRATPEQRISADNQPGRLDHFQFSRTPTLGVVHRGHNGVEVRRILEHRLAAVPAIECVIDYRANSGSIGPWHPRVVAVASFVVKNSRCPPFYTRRFSTSSSGGGGVAGAFNRRSASFAVSAPRRLARSLGPPSEFACRRQPAPTYLTTLCQNIASGHLLVLRAKSRLYPASVRGFGH